MTVVVVLLDRNRDKPGRIINTTNLETWNAFAVAFRNGVLFIASVHWLIWFYGPASSSVPGICSRVPWSWRMNQCLLRIMLWWEVKWKHGVWVYLCRIFYVCTKNGEGRTAFCTRYITLLRGCDRLVVQPEQSPRLVFQWLVLWDRFLEM